MGLVCKTQHAYFSSVNQTHTMRGKYLAYIIAYCEHPRGSQSCPLNTGIVLRTKVCSTKKHGKKSSDLIEPYVRLMPSRPPNFKNFKVSQHYSRTSMCDHFS